MGVFSDFQRGHIFGARLAGASNQTATSLAVCKAAVFKVMTAYRNHGKTSSTNRSNG